MSFAEVADGFVETENFKRLLRNCHTVVMGPRGCGKTTMLKMLYPLAAAKVMSQDEIPFWGIYIPSDRQWSMQLSEMANMLHDDRGASEGLSKALINLNVLYAWCETVEALLSLAGIEEGADTLGFYRQLKDSWKIDHPIQPTMSAVKVQLKQYVAEVNKWVNMGDASKIKIPDVAQYEMTSALSLSIEIFMSAFGDRPLFRNKRHWAICIDEMEIAPNWLRQYIMQCMRSVNQQLLFKITAVPSTSEGSKDSLSSSESNDYELIKTWIYNDISRTEWRAFCSKYISDSILTPMGIDENELKKLLTPGDLDENYLSRHDMLNKTIKDLANIDKSFYQFLLRKGANPNADDVLVTCKRSVVTFTLHAVYERLQLMRNAANIVNPTVYNVYMGEWLLYEYSDGCPRVFINIIKEISQCIGVDQRGQRNLKISGIARLISTTSNTVLYNKLAYYTIVPIIYQDKIITYKEILDAIGIYLNRRLTGEEYEVLPEIYFSYEVKELSIFIDYALESGAIVLIEDPTLYQGVSRNHRVFRLNYGLFPYYHIVKTTSRNIVFIEDILESIILHDT